MSFWTTLRDDLLPWRWHKDDNREAWMRRLGEAALVFTGSGMFAAPAAAAETTAAATTAADLAAAQEALRASALLGDSATAASQFVAAPGAYTPQSVAELMQMGGTLGEKASAAANLAKDSASTALDTAMKKAIADPAGTAWGGAKGAFKAVNAANAITGMFAPQQPMPRGGGMAGGGGKPAPIPELFTNNTPKSPSSLASLSDIDLSTLTPQQLEEIKRLLERSGIRA